MPTVGAGTKASRTFSYSDKGEKQAAAYAKKTGKQETIARGVKPKGPKQNDHDMSGEYGGGTRPRAMSASTAAKQARAGKDMGAPGKGFQKLASAAAREYGSAAAGKRVAGAQFQKMRKAGRL